MSKRGILALAVLAALLLAYVLVFERASVTSKERTARAGRVLVSFVRDKVERLTIQRKGTAVVLTRKPQDDGTFAGFRVLAPYAAKADDDAVDQVLGELEWLSAKRTLDAISKEDETRFGLAAPRYRVTFQAGRDQHTLAIGQGDVHGDSVYVRVDHEPRAYVVPKSVVDVLDHEPGHFRDKQLFPELTVAWAQKLDVEHAAGSQHFAKQAGRWWIAATPRVYADGKRLDELLHALSELRSAHYLEPNEQAAAKAALSSNASRVVVTVVPDETREDKQPRTLSLEFAGPCAGHPGERYARVQTGASSAPAPGAEPGHGARPLVCVSAADLAPFELGSELLREPRLFSADVSAVQGFVLAVGKQKLSLARDGERWKAQSGSAAERVGAVEREAVEGWLADSAAARAVRFGPATEFHAEGSLTLELADAKREQLAFGALNELGELPVKRGDEPALVLFSAAVFDRLQPSSGRFGSLALWAPHQPSEVLRVEASAGGRERVTTLDAGQWRLADAAVATAPAFASERVRELVRALVNLRARSFVSDQLRPDHGISSAARGSSARDPKVEGRGASVREPNQDAAYVKLGLQDGSTLSLQIGAATERGAYARVDGRAIVEVGSDVVPAIVELAGGPRAPAPTAEAEDDEHDEHEEDEPEGEEPAGHEHEAHSP